jgi:REP element-mobilizing transposase RayT
MKRFDHNGTDRLRKGRVSIPGARYFVTVCTESRKHGLENEATSKALINGLRLLHRSANISLHCGTIMPDHVHLLFTLGQNLTLSQTLGKLKAATKDSLEACGLKWQSNFYDHRLRQEVSMESFARYIFLNPYRKKLLAPNQPWPGWVLSRDYTPEFTQHLEAGQFPPHQWLEESGSVEDLIKRDVAPNKGSE